MQVENVGCEYGEELIYISCENEPDTTRINAASADQLLTEEGTDASEIQITGMSQSWIPVIEVQHDCIPQSMYYFCVVYSQQ